MSTRFIKDIAIGILFVIAQVLFFQHLTIFDTSPDPITFYLLWLISRYERSNLLFIAAGLGLLQDAFFDFWGMFMFSKTLLVFLFYSFIKKRTENQLLLWQIFLVIFIAALVQNIIFWGLNSFFDAYASNYSTLLLIFGNTVYTSILGTLVFIFRVK